VYYDESEDTMDDDRDSPEEIEAAMKAMEEIAQMRKQREAAARKQAEEAAKNAPDQPQEEDKPSWSVMERIELARDISKGFGKGRPAKAGRGVTPEEAEKRQQEMRQLIQRVRNRDGVKPEVVAAAETNLTRAEKLQIYREYQRAEYVLRCTREALPFRNKLAGRATLELGTVLDAQGKYEEAAEMYRSLLQHPDRKVRKDATRLVEGIEALAYFNYAKADSKEDSYFVKSMERLLTSFVEKNTENFDASYKASAEDLELERQLNRYATLLVAGLVLFPVAMVWILAQTAHY
jgi:tetratricopeptide (TPR) repeat protein